MTTPPIVSSQDWEAARQELLVTEKSSPALATRWPPSGAGCRGRRCKRNTASMGPAARASLLDLFAGCRQLIVYRLL